MKNIKLKMTKPSDIVAVESDCRMAYEIKCIVFADTLIKYSINTVLMLCHFGALTSRMGSLLDKAETLAGCKRCPECQDT